MEALDPLDNLRAVLRRHEDIQKENHRLQAEVARLEQENEQLRPLEQENEKLRQVIDYGRQALEESEERNAKVREFYTRTLAEQVASSTPKHLDNEITEPHFTNTEKNERGAEIDRPGQRIASTPELIPNVVYLTTGLAGDGSLTIDKTINLPPKVHAAVASTFGEWFAKFPKTKRQHCTFTSSHKCVLTSTRSQNTFWVEGHEQKYACRSCYNADRACLVPAEDGTFIALPLPPALRPAAAVAGEDGFYIAAEGEVALDKADGPWMAEPARKRSRMSMEGY